MPKNLKSVPVDRKRLEGAIKKIKENAHLDIVERCNLFRIPLVLTTDEHRGNAFYAALAELCACYETDSSATEFLMKPFFGKGAMANFRRDGRYDFSYKPDYTSDAMNAIISMAYPWLNSQLYMSLLRVNLESRLDMRVFRSFEGEYRYFRSFPTSDDRFVLTDGRIRVAVNEEKNVIVWGHASRNWRHGDFYKEEYEHRGFIIPGKHKTDLISFRGGVTRFASVAGKLDSQVEGVILTSTRGHGLPARPFVARVLIVRKGEELEKVEIPEKLNSDGTMSFVVESAQYQNVWRHFEKMTDGTIAPEFGFMWGTSSEAARKAEAISHHDKQS